MSGRFERHPIWGMRWPRRRPKNRFTIGKSGRGLALLLPRPGLQRISVEGAVAFLDGLRFLGCETSSPRCGDTEE